MILAPDLLTSVLPYLLSLSGNKLRGHLGCATAVSTVLSVYCCCTLYCTLYAVLCTVLSVVQVTYPKSDEQRQRLNDAVKHILLFRSLEEVHVTLSVCLSVQCTAVQRRITVL